MVEAMKYKLFALLQLLATKQRYLTRGIRRRLQLIQNFLTLKGQKTDATGATIQISPNIPVNLTDIVNNIKNADGIIPRSFTFAWLPNVSDPEELVNQMKQQKADDMKDSQNALGFDATKNIDDEEFKGSDTDDTSGTNK